MGRYLLVIFTMFTVKLKVRPSAEHNNGEEMLESERKEVDYLSKSVRRSELDNSSRHQTNRLSFEFIICVGLQKGMRQSERGAQEWRVRIGVIILTNRDILTSYEGKEDLRV